MFFPSQKENNIASTKEDDMTMVSTDAPTVTTAPTVAPVEDKEFTFVYVLRNYPSLEKVKVHSPWHEFGGFCWRLLIFPRGNQTKNDLSVYLECGGPVNPDGSEKRATDSSSTELSIARHLSPTQTWSRPAHFFLHLVHPSRWADAGVTAADLRAPIDPNDQNSVHVEEPSADVSLSYQHRGVLADVIKDTAHIFRDRESDWGFCEFAQFATLRPGFHCDNNHNAVIKVRIRLDEMDYSAQHLTWDSRKETGFVGFKNQGATCYMNSLLQTLYMLVAFRKAVYEMPLPDVDSTDSDMTYALQKVFYELQFSPYVVKTKKLTESFGWETTDAFTQHDVQELNRILCDHLEEKMKKTDPDKPNKISALFQGKLLNYIECVDVDYKSTREESFYDLSLNVKGCRNIIESFDKYTEVEVMDGDNKYRADGYDELQRARKGAKFMKLPPVLQLHLKRFEYDFHRDAMVKINDRYEFDTEIDLSPYVEKSDGSDIYVLHSVLVHIGDVNGGHYHAFIRTMTEDKPGELAQWLKFDDEQVTKASEKEAVSENFGFGGEKDLALITANNGLKRGKLDMEDDVTNIGLNGQTHPPTQLRRNLQSRRFMNAYMLQYVRKENVSSLLRPMIKAEIPKELSNRITRERLLEEQRQRDRLEQHLYMTLAILVDTDLHTYNGGDLSDWSNCTNKRIKRALKLGELKMELQNEGLIRDASKVRIWKFTRRHNDTLRPQSLVADGDDNRPMSDGTTRDVTQNTYNLYSQPRYEHFAEEPFRIFVEDLTSRYSFGVGEAFIEARQREADRKAAAIPVQTENGPTENSPMDAEDDVAAADQKDEILPDGQQFPDFVRYPLKPDEILLFFKLYKPKPIPTVYFLGYAIVDRTKDLNQTLSVLRRPLERYGISADENMIVFEEKSCGTVIDVSTDVPLERHELASGDIIVLQEPMPVERNSRALRINDGIPVGLETWDFRQEPVREDDKDLPLGGRPMPSARDFYGYLRFRVKMEFKDKSAVDHDILELSADDIVGICLEIMKSDSYLTVRKIVANAIGNGAHPDYLRLFTHDPQRHCPSSEPIRCPDHEQLYKAPNVQLMHNQHLHTSPNGNRVLWYERTEYRLSEFEHKEEVRIVWRWDCGACSSPGSTSTSINIAVPPPVVLMQQTENASAQLTMDVANGPGNETSTTSDDASIDDSTTDSTMPIGDKDINSPTMYGPLPNENIMQIFSVLVPPLSKYSQVIEGIRHRQKLDPNTSIRLLEVRNCRIERIFDPAESIPHMISTYEYPLALRAEPVPVDETPEALGNEYQLVAVAHLAKERHRGVRSVFFGVPFLLRVKRSGMSIADIRELIRDKLGVKEVEFETWRLAEVLSTSNEWLEDSDHVWIPAARTSFSEPLITLAIEHRCPTPRRYQTTHGRFDKPLRIKAR